MKDSKQLTVKELIKELETMPQDLKVMMEGCDCYQEAFKCEVISDPPRDSYVLICNSRSE